MILRAFAIEVLLLLCYCNKGKNILVESVIDKVFVNAVNVEQVSDTQTEIKLLFANHENLTFFIS